jgi:transmembrane sensor
MSGIDKQRIEAYFKGEFSLGEEKYLGEVFTEASNQEELKTIFKNQWDEVLAEGYRTNRLEHILHRMNYLINSSEEKNKNSTVIRLINWYARIAAILLIPVLIYTSLNIYKNSKLVNVKGWAEMNAPQGSRIRFTLPDGSFGWLNSGSTIKYALNFNEARVVQLSGEAFFDVKHEDSHQFVVKTKYMDVEVKGTAFDVAAYSDEDQIDVTLERGSVILKNDRFAAPVEMKPDEQVCYNFNTRTLTKARVTAPYFSSWKEGKLMLRNASLENLAKQLSRWYNVDVSVQNSQLNNDLRYRATFENENLNEVLRLLKISTSIEYKIEERVKQADDSFSKQKVFLSVSNQNNHPLK